MQLDCLHSKRAFHSTTCGQSPVWFYFDKLSNGKASCKTCRYICQVRQIILLVESESFHPGGGELTSGSPTSCSRPKWRWRRSTWANTRTRVWRWSSPILTYVCCSKCQLPSSSGCNVLINKVNNHYLHLFPCFEMAYFFTWCIFKSCLKWLALFAE